jgi:hypothetical protein
VTVLDDAPVSAQQEAMLSAVTHSQAPQVFNVPTRVTLAGPLDVDALRSAINQLVARHVALRCRFTMIDGAWRQQELAPVPVRLDTADLRHLPASEQEHRAGRACRDLAETPFDLGRDTVPRCLLLRLDDERWTLMLVLHHISTDGWAMHTVFRDLAEYYRSALTATPPVLPVPVFQCTDYARWQRAQADPVTEERTVASLRRRLRGATARVDLPTDRPRGAAVSGTGDTVYVTIPRAVREAVEALARARHTTPFSVVAAAFARWLAERARVSDVVLVVGYANRQRLEFESMLSFTTVGLAVPLAVGEAGTFGELVGRTAVGVMAAIDNAVPVSRVLPDPPNVLMVFVYDVQDSVRFTGLETVAVDDVAPMASRREMTWGIVQSEDIAKGYQVWLEYSSDLWNRDSALVMVRDYALSLEVSCAESRAT